VKLVLFVYESWEKCDFLFLNNEIMCFYLCGFDTFFWGWLGFGRGSLVED